MESLRADVFSFKNKASLLHREVKEEIVKSVCELADEALECDYKLKLIRQKHALGKLEKVTLHLRSLYFKRQPDCPGEDT